MLATYGSQTKYIFHLDGFVSLQNSGIWGSENPHVTEPLSLHSPKISKQIGPFFLKQPIIVVQYLGILEEFVGIHAALDDHLNASWHKQDDC